MLSSSTAAGPSSSSAVVPSIVHRSKASASARRKSGSSTSAPEKWRSGAQERIYSRRLVEALRAARAVPRADPRAIKDAADSALALTARGSSRWSRAILAGRFRRRKLLLKAGGKIRRRRRPPRSSAIGATHLETPALKGGKVRDRLRTLARLVPGCRKVSTPSLLKEAADYVAALEMQVRSMRALADALAGASVSTPPDD